jgi:hypothetical protein
MIALVRSAMCDLMPRTPGEDSLPGIADTDVTAFLRAMKRESHPVYWLGLVLGAWTYVTTPFMTVFVPLPSFWLPRKLRELHAQRITITPFYFIRQAVLLVRLSAGLCWGRDPRVRARFELAPYPPDPGTYLRS